MKRPHNTIVVNYALHILGLLLCVAPPAICTLCYFPLWRGNSEKTVVGGVVLVLILSAIPFFKYLKKKLTEVASYIMWLILFVLFFFLSKISDEMTVISFFGFVGNLLGALCFKIERKRDDG